jgi:general stress protein 26
MATAPTQTQTPNKAEHNFLELLRKFDQAMLVTQGSALHGRPMAIAGTEEDGSLWFITRGDTEKVDELTAHSQVLAVMQSSAKWLSISGRAQLSRDRAQIQKLWKESFKVWFESKDDPNIVLIHVHPSEAEYWDDSGIKGLKLALKAAAAYVTGKEVRPDPGDVNTHAKVRL